jgi:hypothetical protein
MTNRHFSSPVRCSSHPSVRQQHCRVRDNTMMLFSDAKAMCENIVKAMEGSSH